jgi:hypothetical protein
VCLGCLDFDSGYVHLNLNHASDSLDPGISYHQSVWSFSCIMQLEFFFFLADLMFHESMSPMQCHASGCPVSLVTRRLPHKTRHDTSDVGPT